MAKMIIMQGLPASGKSTRAEEIQKANGNVVRINKDLLRTMLHFNKWSGRNEGYTRQAARELARTFLKNEVSVIIDDTNLNAGTVQSWVDLAKECDAKIEYERMDTSMIDCITRDVTREKSVGMDVIVQMALQNGLYPKPAKGFVLCDLDGTLANVDHRLHFVKVAEGEKKDWKGFFNAMSEDTVRTETLDMLLKYEDEGHQIIFVSARPDNYREKTEEWLDEIMKGYVMHKTLIMRRADDKRPDTEVKQGIYDTYFKGKYDIAHIIDDRPSVIRMWRANGLDVIDVGPGPEHDF